MAQKPFEIAIFGVGAMACLFAGRLSRLVSSRSLESATGEVQVTMIGSWREQIRTLQQKGLTVINLDGSVSELKPAVTGQITDVPVADVAIILVKSYQTDEVAQHLPRVLGSTGMVLTLQNGLGNVETLAQAVGRDRVGLGITTEAANLKGLGCVEHTGTGPTYFARNAHVDQKLDRVAEAFNSAGFSTTFMENGEGLLWSKLAINCGINPLTALLGVPNGALLECEPYRQMMVRAVEEVVAVATARNITLSFADPVEKAVAVCRATAKNYSSMLQDVLRSRPTEIDAMCGAICELGRQTGTPTPVNEFLLQQVKRKEAGFECHPQTILDFTRRENLLQNSGRSEISVG